MKTSFPILAAGAALLWTSTALAAATLEAMQ